MLLGLCNALLGNEMRGNYEKRTVEIQIRKHLWLADQMMNKVRVSAAGKVHVVEDVRFP